ncbi:hypothetical protein F5Y05DRAFT_369112 [Hypoxylon sp. FL0543]|nr:hypothetical protein F5Y05DRAFT_369112 [Hypoxylon sp. FL0543]
MSHQTPRQDATGTAYYTNLHLSAVSTLYPPIPRGIKHLCGTNPSQATRQGLERITRVYYAEPSYYGYNPGCYMIRETRYGIQKAWHPASDELVADDAAPGSPVVAVGWWVDSDNGVDFKEIWETRVYYIDKNWMIRERTNRSDFNTTLKDDFDAELPEPGKLIPPTPGWKKTPLIDEGLDAGIDGTAFPIISPLRTSKLAAVRTETGDIYVFYQSTDNGVHELVFQPGKGWKQESSKIEYSDAAKPGTPLTALTGAYCEIRLFYVTTEDELGEIYADDHTKWTKTDMPRQKLSNPTAMISAVAWNYATSFFQIHIYFAGEHNKPLRYSFSRNSGGWALEDQSESGSAVRATESLHAPLSAVAAVIVENECNPRVYFHPQRIIAEWDVCKETASFVATGEGGKSRARRKIEEETREKIQEEKRTQNDGGKKEETGGEIIFEEDLRGRNWAMVVVGFKMKLRNKALVERAKKKSKCPQGFEWIKEEHGWRCGGGAHFLSDEDFAAL